MLLNEEKSETKIMEACIMFKEFMNGNIWCKINAISLVAVAMSCIVALSALMLFMVDVAIGALITLTLSESIGVFSAVMCMKSTNKSKD